MTRISLRALACLALLAPAAHADPAPARLALVLGEAAYANLPALPGCTVSAQVIGERLRALGFDVTARPDASNGVMGAALTDFAAQVAAARTPAVAVYFCGYAAVFDNRLFLLPVSATVERPSDVLTQGVPAQSVVDLAARNTRASLSALDTYQRPNAEPGGAEALAAFVAAQAKSPGHFVVAGTETEMSSTATPLAQALSAGLAKPPVDLDAMTASLGKTFQVAGTPGARGPTLLAPPATPAAAVVAPSPAAPPAANAAAALPPRPALTAPAAAPATAPVARSLPEESHYTPSDRREVQDALRALGYYDGAVDGVIGPDTRAAIRRYQHELGAPMTGTLTPAEGTRLLAQAGH
jgi:hypothetical protein